MNTLIHADIFFFVTTICIAVITVLVIIAWIFIIKILANIKKLSEKARVEGELLIDEVGEIRERLGAQNFGIRALFRLIRRFITN